LSVNVKLLCFIQRCLYKMYCITLSHLGVEGEVSSNDICYQGIAAGGLAVSHQDDGPVITRDLNGAQRGACRDNVGHPVLMPDWLT